MSHLLTRLITAEVRPGRGRLEPVCTCITGDPDCEPGCAQAKQRVDPPDFAYDTHGDTAKDTGQPWPDSMPPKITPSEVIYDTQLDAAQLIGDCRCASLELSSPRMGEAKPLYPQTYVPSLPQSVKLTMLDQHYSYNSYLDHDVENEEHCRYDQSSPLRTYLEVPDLPLTGRSELITACADANCVGFPRLNTEPVRGFDVMDIIEPDDLTDALLTQMFMV